MIAERLEGLDEEDLKRRLQRLVSLERDLAWRVEQQALALRGSGPWPGDHALHKRLSFLLYDVKKRIQEVKDEMAKRGQLNDPSTAPGRSAPTGSL